MPKETFFELLLTGYSCAFLGKTTQDKTREKFLLQKTA